MSALALFPDGLSITPSRSTKTPIRVQYRITSDGLGILLPALTNIAKALRMVCPEQFRPQGYTKVPFRRYRVSAQLPNGWTLNISTTDGGGKLNLEFVPPTKEDEIAGGCRE